MLPLTLFNNSEVDLYDPFDCAPSISQKYLDSFLTKSSGESKSSTLIYSKGAGSKSIIFPDSSKYNATSSKKFGSTLSVGITLIVRQILSKAVSALFSLI